MASTRTRALPVLEAVPAPRFDLTRTPALGRFLRWKHARTAVQVPMLLLAAVIIADGFLGPAAAPENAAGVGPWVQWRGFVVLALLIAGNLFCMACPFMLPRRLAKRLLPGDRSWPVRLKGKWLALGLLVLFFWAYEALDLWASPWLTAWLVVAYFTAAFVIDGFFKGAAFCKHVCPIGSFNFVNSLASPTEVRVRDSSVCERCETKDCIAGRYEPLPATGDAGVPAGMGTAGGMAGVGVAARRKVQSGCELWLFQPQKVGNLDCTFCLDCIQACPYENVGIVARLPGAELVRDPRRSGVGRLTERPDVLALTLVVVFAAFVNAAGMIGPVLRGREALGAALGTGSELLSWSVFMLLGLVAVPAALLALTTWASGALAGRSVPRRRILLRMGYGLVPVGFGMWLAHYAFHFLAGGLTLVPVLQRAALDVGLVAGTPNWTLGPIVPASWMIPLELLMLEAGLLGSIVLLYYISRATLPTLALARRVFVPWAALAILLAAAGLWIMTQPMAMRGMPMPGPDMPGMEMPVQDAAERSPDGDGHGVGGH